MKKAQASRDQEAINKAQEKLNSRLKDFEKKGKNYQNAHKAKMASAKVKCTKCPEGKIDWVNKISPVSELHVEAGKYVDNNNYDGVRDRLYKAKV